jgi:hypothetical protein
MDARSQFGKRIKWDHGGGRVALRTVTTLNMIFSVANSNCLAQY